MTGMGDCCSPSAYRRIFSEDRAQANARRYRRRGLDAVSRSIVELLRGRGADGRTVLEVGGGIGAIEIELLRAGAAGAVSVELTPTYEGVAASLLRETGFAGRVERRVMDFAERDEEVAPADFVVLNRVICCYPDMPRLAGAAARHTGAVLVMSFPRRTWWTRLLIGIANVAFRVTRQGFRVFVHEPDRVRATAEREGLRPWHDHRGVFWQVVAFERA
jgi:magnesium-protoporphyrin O-methyltransferase